jgi:hypothetical protein
MLCGWPFLLDCGSLDFISLSLLGEGRGEGIPRRLGPHPNPLPKGRGRDYKPDAFCNRRRHCVVGAVQI